MVPNLPTNRSTCPTRKEPDWRIICQLLPDLRVWEKKREGSGSGSRFEAHKKIRETRRWVLPTGCKHARLRLKTLHYLLLTRQCMPGGTLSRGQSGQGHRSEEAQLPMMRVKGCTSGTRAEKRLQKCQRIYASISRREDRVLYADLRAQRIQGLREEGRRLALAHVGIRRSVIAPDGRPWRDRIITLVKEWAATWQIVLNLPQKTEIAEHFGSKFVSFLNTNPPAMTWQRKST
ncbi:g8373 [Coccomyxa viridis]|uniref:G8373 protein n=1 Tax=Coccomyxa viridis TaxID=1274662 RepID=A0ABP1G4B6_9CHLO